MHTQAALVRLHARTRAIAAARADARRSLANARKGLTLAQRRLADRLRALYEQGDTDPMTVLLGAKSLDEAITALENLHRLAGEDSWTIKQAQAARHRLVEVSTRLAADEAQARQTEEATAASIVALQAAKREQAATIASIAAHRSSNSATISGLEAQAQAAAQPRSAPTYAPGPAGAGRQLTVTATGYSLSGKTATGVPVGYGIVAVDPGVIPLGTRMTIPGYGAGVAADTGGAVVGDRIDLWFPTQAEALAWGTRIVTITLR